MIRTAPMRRLNQLTRLLAKETGLLAPRGIGWIAASLILVLSSMAIACSAQTNHTSTSGLTPDGQGTSTTERARPAGNGFSGELIIDAVSGGDDSLSLCEPLDSSVVSFVQSAVNDKAFSVTVDKIPPPAITMGSGGGVDGVSCDWQNLVNVVSLANLGSTKFYALANLSVEVDWNSVRDNTSLGCNQIPIADVCSLVTLPTGRAAAIGVGSDQSLSISTRDSKGRDVFVEFDTTPAAGAGDGSEVSAGSYVAPSRSTFEVLAGKAAQLTA